MVLAQVILYSASRESLIRSLSHKRILYSANAVLAIGAYSPLLFQHRSFRPPARRSFPRRTLSPSPKPILNGSVDAKVLPLSTPITTTDILNNGPLQPLPELINTPVVLPTPEASHILQESASISSVLAHPALVISRQLEMMSVLIGYEQANKYSIKDPGGTDVGFIAEEEMSFSGTILRQLLRTRRAFKAVVLDRSGTVVLKLIGREWHLWRRRYELFMKKRQFAGIDGQFWAWDFELKDEHDGRLGSVNRNFVGFAREIFTDTGQYAIHMDSTPDLARPLSLDERAVMMATAISIDIDYFSRHSHSGGGWMPIPMFGMGGGSSGEGTSSVPASTDAIPSIPGGGGGSPLPIFMPGAGIGGSGGDSPMPPSPPSFPSGGTEANPLSEQTNQWGELPFLSDEQAGVSSEDTGISIGQVFKWFTDD
ncbi:hypothetical protein BSLG_006853 [Batrachochytrium salamandrivorans]|nr:hypothetical protein BSLG_006853 [Batrachochytrium salamandrivorans]